MTTAVEHDTKACAKCKKVQPLDQFQPQPGSNWTRPTGKCLDCRTKASTATARWRGTDRTKTCADCGETHPLADYPRDWDAPDRRGTVCAPCTAASAAMAQFVACADGLEVGCAPSARVAVRAEPSRGEWGDWRHRAACRFEDPELFHPVGVTGPALLQIQDAKAVCRRCPVAETCLQYALEEGLDSGVFGGLAEDERKALKRKVQRNRSKQNA